ncbi:MAG: hypothetical protein CM15mP112_05320 [Flavobacteriales bacterium]|nr:MAG: hypothetical protein CM15mP112_05320 [Flavobacteriales bacterium]
MTGFHTPIIVNSNQAISSGSSGDGTVINGYLAHENYFVGGGVGGGSSSVTIDYDSLASLISSDTTFITNVGAGISGGGCDILFPEGLDGEAVTINSSYNNQYVVPSGKRLYITCDRPIYFNTNNASLGMQQLSNTDGKPLIFNSGESIHSNFDSFNGLLVDENPAVLAVTINSSYNNQYVVPSGKRLYVTCDRPIYFNP